jgi:hypothetical protein
MSVAPIVKDSDDTGLWDSLFDAEEKAAFAELRTAGGPGSGRYPKGSGKNPQAGMSQTWRASGQKKDGAELAIQGDVSPEMVQKVFGLYHPFDASFHLTEIAESMVESVPGEVEVTWRQAKSGRDAIFMKATRGDGLELLRTFSREDGGELQVRHDVFQVPTSEQGSGLAKQVLADSYDIYTDLGVDQIKTHANLNVGGYAWAKFGFKTDDPESLARQISQRASSLPNAVLVEVADIISAHRSDPKLPWYIAGITHGEDQIGKKLLLGTEWDGVLDMHDKESVSRFKHYVKGKS